MSEEKTASNIDQSETLENGTYEVLKNRLQSSTRDLIDTQKKLDGQRKSVFGSIETSLIGTDRITTEHNCIPWDMVPVGNKFIFGYNVHLGLKNQVELSDVFSVHQYVDHSFPVSDLAIIEDQQFKDDFHKLYKYYKETRFVKFAIIGPYLFMVFKIGKLSSDIKTFKWLIDGSELKYVDNRSDHEFEFPPQHDFEWKRTTRDDHRKGEFPHISVEDKIFIETTGGDLTIKVEDNTDTGRGIYSEEVDNPDQTLDDADVNYAILGNLILLKIRPYQENQHRYIVYNSKLQEARRINAISESCILLPDDQGIIFSNGYYLQNGDFKLFDNDLEHMVFEKTISSPNGEDYLYVYYNRQSGLYLLLPYNIIKQKVENPIVCHGYALFQNGELCYFNADDEPKKHHSTKIWQTPFTGPDFQVESAQSDSFLFKVGNKEIVKAMAECNEIITLVQKGENYKNLYDDLNKMATDIIDSYHWLGHEEAYNAAKFLLEIKEVASSAIDEYDKVVQIRKNTNQQLDNVFGRVDELLKKINLTTHKSLDQYVKNLTSLRELRGETESLKSLRYVDVEKVEKYEELLKEESLRYSDSCVRFLLREDSLDDYKSKVNQLEDDLEKVEKVIDIEELDKESERIAKGLEMLIDIVGNLKISDPTKTTQIIENISALFSNLNKIRSNFKKKKRAMMLVEGKAEFVAQIKLVEQGVTNYLDLSDTPKKCDEYLAKLMIQLEELEGKFVEFNEFIEKISEKREEIYNAFESRKVQLVEAKNKRTTSLVQSADRILGAAKSRAERMNSVSEINGYFSSDLMIEKLRNIIAELSELGDTVKSDDVQSRLKSLKEDAIRQLRDKTELFEQGKDIIKFGNYKFSVNTQKPEITIVPKDNSLYFHLTGTNLYEEITNEKINESKQVWNQSLISENEQVYRAEFLAYQIFKEGRAGNLRDVDEELSLDDLTKYTIAQLNDLVNKFMATRYEEGYVKGIHDSDAALILNSILKFNRSGGLLCYSSKSRAAARYFWEYSIDDDLKSTLDTRIKGLGIIIEVFPDLKEYQQVIEELKQLLSDKLPEEFEDFPLKSVSEYLFYEIKDQNEFIISYDAFTLCEDFKKYLKKRKVDARFKQSVNSVKKTSDRFALIRKWIEAYVDNSDNLSQEDFIDEASLIILSGKKSERTINVPLIENLEGFQGSHPKINDGVYQLNFNRFIDRMTKYEEEVVPQFRQFHEIKRQLIEEFNEDLRFEEFKPKVMSSFVRNKLINVVYLPMIGANLAKQIGETGASKRTDLMGMLLLISPPGYGKTTLMEYIANRLGVIFMKINGPAIGHSVTSVDPGEATNAAAREELKKLNLAFEMGDNVMIYLDDIQHCNPEFLQKFISLCDGQRKIEGVYKGKSKTYDFRGKKVSVVMAGNPYTESGEKFQIPDMLANRADVYNLGDIIGDSDQAFKLSYIENCITSNPVLNKLAGKSLEDVYTLVSAAERDSIEGAQFETNHSQAEIKEYISVFKKLFEVRDVILKVNMEYIRSAGQADEYRTEPPFKLQGSYRDMNKIAEKVFSVMNDSELKVLVDSHYENEAQTLTVGAEANLLKLKELNNELLNSDLERWNHIKELFVKQQKIKGYGSGNQMGQMLGQVEELTKGLIGIRDVLSNNKDTE
ncbi:DNA repair ATPase [Mangrovivirga cuniculi]|uniref:AAA family ATPase n=1 Tax=Mangrovivirga cuniculi TaxID=2715131 RepID=A0A4D7JXG4_9BACT|nr:DNA repair ATPase [Mangrovivirga cuniculi]QCK16846.1 AAA family ATPase [Mangrovivirga cuniculi]